MILGSIIDVLRPFAGVVLPAIFVGFFIVTGVALALQGSQRVRRTYLAGFMVALLLFQTSIIPLAVPPFVTWHKFSGPWDQERVVYEVRVVDDNGRELKYDDKATLAFDGVRMTALHNEMTEEYSDEKNRVIAEYLLQRAATYRSGIERGDPQRGLVWTATGINPTQLLRFPAHGHTVAWTAEQLDGYGEFVGIRLYRVTFVTSPDGTEVTSYEEQVVFEYHEETASDPNTTAAVDGGAVRVH